MLCDGRFQHGVEFKRSSDLGKRNTSNTTMHNELGLFAWNLKRRKNKSINQSINRPTTKSVNQSINQSIDRPLNQSMNQWINESIDRPTTKSVNQSINQSTNHWISQSINQSIDQPLNQSMKQSINQSIDRSMGQSINQSISQSTGLMNQSPDYPCEQHLRVGRNDDNFRRPCGAMHFPVQMPVETA